MQLNFEAIVLSAVKYGENSGIACILTEEHGIYKGLVRGITGTRQRGLYQPGNIIEASWRARLAENLGNLSAGLINTSAMAIMNEPIKLAALSSLCATLEATLQERDSAPTIYNNFKNFLAEIAHNDTAWQKSYVSLEMELLAQLGFGLDLSSCAATGILEDLIYVSPKSGRAVCREAGLPYHDKLFKLPEFLSQENPPTQEISIAQINEGINLCGYFLDKYFFAPHNIKQPQARSRFAAMMKKEPMAGIA